MKILFLILLFFNPLIVNARFPAGKCVSGQCDTSPYELSWTYPSQTGGQCFTINNKSCKGECCNYLETRLQKIVIKVNPMCDKPIFKKVTVDGLQKTGGVYFDLYNSKQEAELRITSLHANVSNIIDKVFCIEYEHNSTCQNDFQYRHLGNTMQYAVYDPYFHTCCPLCNLENVSPQSIQLPPPSPPSPPPPPPSPSPPSPSPSPPSPPPSPQSPPPPSPQPPPPPSSQSPLPPSSQSPPPPSPPQSPLPPSSQSPPPPSPPLSPQSPPPSPLYEIIMARNNECLECPSLFNYVVCDVTTMKMYINPCVAACYGVPPNIWVSGYCEEAQYPPPPPLQPVDSCNCICE